MSGICLTKHNLKVSPRLFKKLFLRLNIRSNLETIGKLPHRKQFHSSAILMGKIERTKTNNVYNIRRLFSLAKPERYHLAAGIGLLVISSSVTMSIPFAMGKVIDMIYKIDQLKSNSENRKSEDNIVDTLTSEERNQITKKLQNVCIALVGVFTVGALANFGRVYLMRMVSQRIAARIRNSFYSSIVNQEIAFFDRNKTGELINRLSADTLLVSEAISTKVSDGLRSTFMTGAGIGMMTYMSPQLALVSLTVVPPVAAYGIFMGRKVRNTSRKVQDNLAASTQVAEEKISNIRTVRTFAKEDVEIDRFGKEMNNVIDSADKEARVQAQFYGWTGFSGNMIILTVLYYGGSLVTSDVISVGNLTSFILYAAYVGIGLSGLSSSYAETMKAVGAGSRIWEIVDKQPLIQLNSEDQILPKNSLKGNIEFRNVNFSYPTRKDALILKDFNLQVSCNTVTAVVGSSGSGKSTLASLILRLYDPDRGTISIDGYDIRQLNSKWLRRQIGSVSQEPVLFSSSIRDNIIYGANEHVSQTEIEKAAKEANAHDFILNFPEGYETMVGERGVMLSGGQKQRIALARAILKNPQILLLDEATSALDTASEHQVKLALDRVMKGRCVIMIAHRLSTIKSANQIVVLENGTIVEKGTYDELVAIDGGSFKSLIRR